MNWLLPEGVADALPLEAATIEHYRRRLLDLCRTCGYELVMPPLVEYLDSLLTGSGQDLRLRTFKLVDQLSGRTLGVRADITPQVARIDAHLLNRQGVTRLCYCGSVLHTLPAHVNTSREPLQLGAELYGYAGHEADLEIIRLMAAVLAAAGAPPARIDLGHVGVFRALSKAVGWSADDEALALSFLQSKDVPALSRFCAATADPYRSALLALPGLYGGTEVLERATRELPALPEILEALATLRYLAEAMPELSLSFDFSDLRGYHYHNGVVFAAYCADFPGAVALGGRYDGVGAAFGRARPATGFSMDLRLLVRTMRPLPAVGAILSPPAEGDVALQTLVARLRAEGEVVVVLLPGQDRIEGLPCDRRLVCQQGRWVLEMLTTNDREV